MCKQIKSREDARTQNRTVLQETCKPKHLFLLLMQSSLKYTQFACSGEPLGHLISADVFNFDLLTHS